MTFSSGTEAMAHPATLIYPKQAFISFSCSFLIFLTGCCSPGMVDRSVIEPISEKTGPKTYRELLLRLRGQATVATDGFYTNDWDGLQATAKAMGQTAQLLPKALEIPEPAKGKISQVSATIEKESNQLFSAAKNRDANLTHESIQKIHLEIRQLNMVP